MKIQIYNYSCDEVQGALEPLSIKYSVARNKIPEVAVQFLSSDLTNFYSDTTSTTSSEMYWPVQIGNTIKLTSNTRGSNSEEWYIISKIDINEIYCNVTAYSIAYEFRNAYCTAWNSTLWSAETKTLTQMVGTLNQALQNPSVNYKITNNRGYIGNAGMTFVMYGADYSTIQGEFDFLFMQGDAIIDAIVDTYGCEVIYDVNKIVFTYQKPVDYYANTYSLTIDQKSILRTNTNVNDFSYSANEGDIVGCILPTYSIEENNRKEKNTYQTNTGVVYNDSLRTEKGTSWCNQHTLVQNYSPTVNTEWNREIWGAFVGRNAEWAYDTIEYENGYEEDYIKVYSWAGELIGQVAWTSPTTTITYNVPYINDSSQIIGTVTVTPGTSIAYTIDAQIKMQYYGGVVNTSTAEITTPVWVADSPSDLQNKDVVNPLGQKSDAHFIGDANMGNSTTATRYNFLYQTTDTGTEVMVYACYLYYKQTYADYSTKLYAEILNMAQLDVNSQCNINSIENISGTIEEGINTLFGGDEFLIITNKLKMQFTQYVESFDYDGLTKKYSNIQFGYKKPTLQVLGALALKKQNTKSNSQKK